MSRMAEEVVRLINQGAYTPQTARLEADALCLISHRFFADAIDILVRWAMEKEDYLVRMVEQAYADAMTAEINTARNMRLDVWERNYGLRLAAEPATVTFDGEEPF